MLAGKRGYRWDWGSDLSTAVLPDLLHHLNVQCMDLDQVLPLGLDHS